MYRISYGNGQVSETFKNLKEAIKEMNMQKEYSRRIGQTAFICYLSIQKYIGAGDWTTVKEDKP